MAICNSNGVFLLVQNYMETLVDDMLREELAENPHKYANMCQCPLCIARIEATALNALPTKYVTGTTGKVFGEYESRGPQNTSDIMAAIGKGIAEVTAHPPHP